MWKFLRIYINLIQIMQWASKLKTSHTWEKYHLENPFKCIERANFVQLLQFHRLLSVTFHFGYLPSIHIFQIAVTNIISSIAGLCLKYNNQMVRNSKPAIAWYENAILTLSNLKNLFFSSISFKMSINRSTCENTFFVIVHISS